MPIYEYECQKCGTQLEVVQKITASPLKKCNDNGCNGRLRRLISNSSFVLKGSGWYVTDYPSQARKKGMESESKTVKSKSDNGKKPSKTKASGNGKKSSDARKTKEKTVSTN